jgi:hypothetical protein
VARHARAGRTSSFSFRGKSDDHSFSMNNVLRLHA